MLGRMLWQQRAVRGRLVHLQRWLDGCELHDDHSVRSGRLQWEGRLHAWHLQLPRWYVTCLLDYLLAYFTYLIT